MSGSQHTFNSNFGGGGQNDIRSQYGGPQRGQLSGISSPNQSSMGISSPQTYNVGVSMQPPADSPIQASQLQQSCQPTPQQLQLHMQRQQQQQQAAQQTVENPQQATQPASVPQSHSQQGVPSQQSPVSQQTSLQPLQQVAPPGSQNVNACLTAGDGPMQSVSQSTVGSTGVVSATGVSGPAPQQPTNQQYNTASLCMFGQETVQEIVSKLQDTFHLLKTVLPPSGLLGATNASNEKKQKLCECLKVVRTLFKRLRMIYERVNDSNQLPGTEYMHIESLIPLKEEWDVKTSEERKTSESYRLASEECKELIDQVIVKNSQLKEVVDRLRRIIWEVNTMLTMRKS